MQKSEAEYRDHDILDEVNERRETIANDAREVLQGLRNKFPEVQFLTLNLKQLYGHSTLRVYNKKPKQAKPETLPLNSDDIEELDEKFLTN
jgi:hypothetical protein